MSLPTVEPLLPENNEPLPPARRRRKQRTIVPPGESERAGLLAELSARVVPSFDFFLFSILSGIVLGAALLVDSPALVFLAALVAPFMAPVIGTSLGTVTGAGRYWLQALASLLIGSLIVLLFGLLAGWAAVELPGRTNLQALTLSQFSWAGFVVLALGAGFSTYLVVRNPHQRPLVTSVAIAYSLYLPAGAAGFALGSDLPGLWTAGLSLYAFYLVWSVLISALVLLAVGLRPLKGAGVLLVSANFLAGIAAFALILLPGIPGLPVATVHTPSPPALEATLSPTALVQAAALTSTLEATATVPTSTPSATPEPPTPTFTPTRTLVPTRTHTLTLSPAPTPVWARVKAKEGNGILVRAEPSYSSIVVQSLLNDTLVELLPEIVTAEGTSWVKVRTVNDKIGWVVSSLLATATPSP